jgi:plastocyanin
MMKSIKILSLSGLLALALAGCLGPPPTVAPNVSPATGTPSLIVTAATLAPNTPQPASYPAASSPTPPPTVTRGPYPAAASPTAATIKPTAIPSDTAIPNTPTPAASATAATVFMTYQDFEIVPAEMTIKVGTKITFLIKSASGAKHQPYSFDPPYHFDSPNNLGDGTSISFTFDKPGTINLLCGYHRNMHATLTIEP